MRLEAGDADSDEPERAGAIVERPVEKPARQLADSIGIVGAD